MPLVADDLAHRLLVTTDAVVLQRLRVMIANANRFVKVLEGEAFAMPDAVLRFGQILRNESVRGVAVVAGGDGMMAAMLPAIELLAHDMAIHAGVGIVAEVRKALTV